MATFIVINTCIVDDYFGQIVVLWVNLFRIYRFNLYVGFCPLTNHRSVTELKVSNEFFGCLCIESILDREGSLKNLLFKGWLCK